MALVLGRFGHSASKISLLLTVDVVRVVPTRAMGARRGDTFLVYQPMVQSLEEVGEALGNKGLEKINTTNGFPGDTGVCST